MKNIILWLMIISLGLSANEVVCNYAKGEMVKSYKRLSFAIERSSKYEIEKEVKSVIKGIETVLIECVLSEAETQNYTSVRANILDIMKR